MSKRIEQLYDAFKVSIKSQELFDSFLRDILTPTEYREILNRWEIIKQLDKGKQHHAIAEELGIGVGTVTRGSRELADASGGFSRVLTLLKKK